MDISNREENENTVMHTKPEELVQKNASTVNVFKIQATEVRVEVICVNPP